MVVVAVVVQVDWWSWFTEVGFILFCPWSYHGQGSRQGQASGVAGLGVLVFKSLGDGWHGLVRRVADQVVVSAFFNIDDIGRRFVPFLWDYIGTITAM